MNAVSHQSKHENIAHIGATPSEHQHAACNVPNVETGVPGVVTTCISLFLLRPLRKWGFQHRI